MTAKQILQWLEAHAEVVYRIHPSERSAFVLWKPTGNNLPYRSLKEAVEDQARKKEVNGK